MRLGATGLLITAVYFALVGYLVFSNWPGFAKLSPNEWGDFLAGSFGPLALAWIVLGFFLQGKELRNSVETLKLQTEELKRSVEQQKAMVLATEQQVELDKIAREREADAIIEQRKPHFLVSLNGSQYAAGGTAIQKLSILNTGAVAQSAHFTIPKSNVQNIVLAGKTKSPFKSNEEWQTNFSYESHNTQDFDVEFHVIATNSRGEAISQLFQITRENAELIESKPLA